jgi:hypothetical protein
MKRLVAICSVALLAVAPIASAELSLNHTPISCVASAGHAKIVASGEGLASARVFFKSNAGKSEYYVEMLQGPDGFWAVLPAPSAETTSIAYRIVGRDASGNEKSVSVGNVPVSPACASFALTEDESRIANNLVIGQTTQVVGLAGFQCEGVVNTITLSGEMRPYTECDDDVAPAVLAAGGAAGSTLARTIAIAGVGASAAAISVVAIDNQNDDRDPVSPILP